MPASTQTKLEQDLKESQSKCVQLEHDLKEEKSKRVQAERDLKWAQRDIESLLSDVAQHKQDIRTEKSKSTKPEPEPDHNKNIKPANESTQTTVVQQLMDDLDEFVRTVTCIGLEIEALYGIQSPAAEVEEL